MAQGKPQKDGLDGAAVTAEEAYLRTPVGRADWAWRNGDAFFQIELDVATLRGKPSTLGSSHNAVRTSGRPDILGQIEDVGWHLEHVGYVFVETGSTSTNRFLSTGQGTVMRGSVLGIYLFRAKPPPAELDSR